MDRVKILYGDEGEKTKDGVIEIRRGTADLNLGDSHYAQVRIMADGTHYLKGMAMYGNDTDFPDGVDIIKTLMLYKLSKLIFHINMVDFNATFVEFDKN